MEKLVKILFICHGNICRSPMAEFIFKDIVAKAGRSGNFLIKSAATSTEEIGNAVYPPAKRELGKFGISCEGKVAVQVTKQDYQTYDYLVVMDNYNVRNLMRIIHDDPQEKVWKLLDFPIFEKEKSSGCRLFGDDISDPWYTGDFATTYNDIHKGCTALFNTIFA